MWTILLLEACLFAPEADPLSPRELTCRDVALRDDEGRVDLCDLDACETCVSSCGRDCVVLESDPPRYTCPGTAWDVYDFCPDWVVAEGPRASDVSVPTCGKDPGEALSVRAIDRGRVEVRHVDFATGCCPESVVVDIVVEAPVVDVTYAVLGDVCDCACGLDVSYVIEDLPAGEWTVVAGSSASTLTFEVP